MPTFIQAMQLASLLRPIRRAVWRPGLYSDVACRAHFFGTFSISVVGSLDVRLTYDHRVIDGDAAARAHAELEAEPHAEIRTELDSLANENTANDKQAPSHLTAQS